MQDFKVDNFFFEIQNLPDMANQLWWAGRLQFTYYSMISYLSEWFLHKLVYFIDLKS